MIEYLNSIITLTPGWTLATILLLAGILGAITGLIAAKIVCKLGESKK